MMPFSFFKPEDKKIKDTCPVCRKTLGHSYIRLERNYLCDECDWYVMFFPYENEPHMIKKKKTSEKLIEHQDFPGEESLPRYYPNEDDEPKGPKLPPWWI